MKAGVKQGSMLQAICTDSSYQNYSEFNYSKAAYHDCAIPSTKYGMCDQRWKQCDNGALQFGNTGSLLEEIGDEAFSGTAIKSLGLETIEPMKSGWIHAGDWSSRSVQLNWCERCVHGISRSRCVVCTPVSKLSRIGLNACPKSMSPNCGMCCPGMPRTALQKDLCLPYQEYDRLTLEEKLWGVCDFSGTDRLNHFNYWTLNHSVSNQSFTGTIVKGRCGTRCLTTSAPTWLPSSCKPTQSADQVMEWKIRNGLATRAPFSAATRASVVWLLPFITAMVTFM